jgi:TIR domain-containing protein
MRTPSIFLSHNHRDKPFVRTLAQDLRALGAKVWLDEAEIQVGDSIITSISSAIDEMQFLGIVLSPNSVESRWVREELNQALANQLSRSDVVVLPILIADCSIPGFLRDKRYADFRDSESYHTALSGLMRAIGIAEPTPGRGSVVDPFAARFDRVAHHYVRPKSWHCIFCGVRMHEHNTYLCTGCGTVRPFVGDSATLVLCPECGDGSLGLARYCEWCGAHITRSTGEHVTFRCAYNTARIAQCLRAPGDTLNAGDAVLRLEVPNSRTGELDATVHFACTLEEVYVAAGQTVFSGTRLYKVFRS